MDAVQVRDPMVGAPIDAMLYEQLLDRQQRLRDAEFENLVSADVTRLLSEVDAALLRFQAGTYGLCEECHDPIEPERLVADPLVRLCLGDLTQKQLDDMQQDLQLAAEIQRGLLPKGAISYEFWQADLAYHPAGVVSGDYVDVMQQNGELFFMLGDVSGKGMAASILMSNLHAMFRALIPVGLELCDLLSRANLLFA